MKGKLLLADAEGAFGSPIVDSVRTSVKDGASQLLQVIFFHPMLSVKQQDEIIGSTARMLTEINGGEVVFADAVRAIS
jgi:DNA/RNA-binding domain of Phe-tRNA-synthetase-like protein